MITTIEDLEKEIQRLEDKKSSVETDIQGLFTDFKKDLSPLSLLKSSFKSAPKTNLLEKNIIEIILGVVLGLVAKKVSGKVSKESLEKAIGSVTAIGIQRLLNKGGQQSSPIQWKAILREIASDLISKIASKTTK